jgi:hypothetical protein
VNPLVTVIVPVLGRPQNAEPFMTSLRKTTRLAYGARVMCSDGADTETWWKLGANTVCNPGRVSFPAKVNDAIHDGIDTPWVFITGDDVRFHPRWLIEAVAAGAGKDVVGTNDLGNPRVTSGRHSGHLLIRTSYIRERGASWDGAGIVCHEGYRHWFVDDEIVRVAKERGVWGFAKDSIVEHMHPMWGKAPDDDTYAIADKYREKDLELFRYRCLKYGAV